MTMNTYQETMRKLYDPENHEVLIASHRGKFSSSVMENTSLAFLTAIGRCGYGGNGSGRDKGRKDCRSS